MAQRKHFIPLESNPDVFTQLAGRLGLSSKFAFHDVLSLDDPDLLAFLPRPALALVLVFPASQGPTYDEDKADKNKGAAAYDGSSGEETVIWFKQTIYNACGLYGILHALSNGEAQENLAPDSLLSRILAEATPLGTLDRARVLESSAELEAAHTAVAVQGDTAAPPAEDEVEHHYVCFVKSGGRLYELDGDLDGPVDLGVALDSDQDVLSEPALAAVRTFVQRSKGDVGFSLLALTPALED